VYGALLRHSKRVWKVLSKQDVVDLANLMFAASPPWPINVARELPPQCNTATSIHYWNITIEVKVLDTP